jgi:hypothetical protein
MNPGELQKIEAERQSLLGQLTAAETALRNGLRTHGFGETARAHMERAHAHISEAFIAINEGRPVRTVSQLVDDLNRVQKVMNYMRRRNSQHI